MQPQFADLLIEEKHGTQIALEQAGKLFGHVTQHFIQGRVGYRQTCDSAQRF